MHLLRLSQFKDCKTIFYCCLLHLVSSSKLGVRTNAQKGFKIYQQCPPHYRYTITQWSHLKSHVLHTVVLHTVVTHIHCTHSSVGLILNLYIPLVPYICFQTFVVTQGSLAQFSLSVVHILNLHHIGLSPGMIKLYTSRETSKQTLLTYTMFTLKIFYQHNSTTVYAYN